MYTEMAAGSYFVIHIIYHLSFAIILVFCNIVNNDELISDDDDLMNNN